ncbi:MAG: CBS domain-containing protein [Euryarchaeota archaeon]|jgi:CBS domain-containing protein|nr:CBS domain-containing protein [Euryarchaeota archaeon]MBT3654252.1 CBS domain-containing protein [Euryarchaeota archaeon]MBT3758062.1 CBS domain-containing protein [Euryarchaeota archaeon]MBT4050313.1 CBS domain-containing protein [Euryarchaeota archaeon]MBT4346609.1 CBS domain-containing protein [Euryarchaeota archaeon]|tara:strand:+ start:71 stop:493 length:423 start_codon:yes stop_codon:yes gene_type:complete
MQIPLDVKNIIDEKLVKLELTTTVTEAMKSMHEEQVWSVIVTINGEPHGVVTERDLLRRCFREKKDPDFVTLGEIMSYPLITIDNDLPIGSALNLLMTDGIRRVYVTDNNGIIIGRITQTGTLEATLNAILKMQQTFSQI